jgi:hypothetical protein
LKIEKSKDGKTYTLTYDTTPTDKLDIDYVDDADVIDYTDESLWTQHETINYPAKTFFDIDGIGFEKLKEAQDIVE